MVRKINPTDQTVFHCHCPVCHQDFEAKKGTPALETDDQMFLADEQAGEPFRKAWWSLKRFYHEIKVWGLVKRYFSVCPNCGYQEELGHMILQENHHTTQKTFQYFNDWC